MNSKKNQIAPVSIFFLLYISRIVVSLTCIQHVTAGRMSSDVMISITLALLLNLLISLPAIFCCYKNKSPFDVKGVNWFYAAYFVFLAGVNVSRFSYFASSVINPEAKAWIFSLLIAICVCYASQLGIEGLSRFSAFAFILIVSSIVFGLACNIKNYNEINLYPVIVNSNKDIIKNIFYVVSSSTEVPILLCLKKRVNGSPVKPYVFSTLAAFLTTFLLILFVNATMGDAAQLSSFPVYTLFQLAKIGLFERLDAFLISLWIFGIFIKAVLLIYCASTSIKPFKNNVKCIVFTIISLGVALAFTEMMKATTSPIGVYIVPYLISCLIIPLLTLIFKKRNLGDELIEKF